MSLITFIPENTSIPFMRYSKAAALLSLLLSCAIIAYIAIKGMTLGIDFAGGVLVEIRAEKPVELSELRPLFNNPDYGDTSLQHFGDTRDVLIRIAGKEGVEQATIVEQVKAAIIAHMGESVIFRRVDYVGPTIGQEMLESGAYAMLFAFIGMLLYIWFRFEWQFGVGALLALIHDTIMVMGFYAVTGLEFGLTAIAAILTVIGYSINDSVVIYDRIRENMRKYNTKPLSDIIDMSLNQTLSRTILTGVTTVIAAATLALFGGAIIQGFALALCVGVIVGTYSSIYISAPLLLKFNLATDVFTATEQKVA